MTVALDRADVHRFRSLVTRRLGLAFENGRLDFLTDVLRLRLEEGPAADPLAYLSRLEGPGWIEEWRVLADKLTVAETYFFRYRDHFRAFSDVVLAEARPPRELRILSAGSASGEEAYSLAILARERLGEGAPARILGVDVNPTVIEKARRGRYSPWALRETPDDLRDRHFRPEGRDYVLDCAIRARVAFEERNLVDPDPAFWRPDAFDVVFCRNVTMYFPLEVSRAVISRIARSLAPGGYLFLGHAETLRGVSDEFHLRHTHETFYYQRRREHEPPPESAFPPPATSLPAPAAPAALPDGSWVDAIQRASDRIASLAAPPASPPPERPWDLGVILELVRKERFDEALKLLRGLPAESARDPDAQTLRAVILTNSGDLKGAKETCRQILAADELNAGAHYLLALCLEHEGDRGGAAEEDQTAAYLDPAFAMPRLHLGLLAKRRGDVELARQELERALPLIAREDASRILLFGGGFSRDALGELCRRELRACGGTP